MSRIGKRSVKASKKVASKQEKKEAPAVVLASFLPFAVDEQKLAALAEAGYVMPQEWPQPALAALDMNSAGGWEQKGDGIYVAPGGTQFKRVGLSVTPQVVGLSKKGSPARLVVASEERPAWLPKATRTKREGAHDGKLATGRYGSGKRGAAAIDLGPRPRTGAKSPELREWERRFRAWTNAKEQGVPFVEPGAKGAKKEKAAKGAKKVKAVKQEKEQEQPKRVSAKEARAIAEAHTASIRKPVKQAKANEGPAVLRKLLAFPKSAQVARKGTGKRAARSA